MRLFGRSLRDLPLEERRRKILGTAGLISALLAAGFVFGALRVFTALHSGRVWVNSRGEVLTQADLRSELVFLLVGAVLSSALAWFWLHVRRRAKS
jgi:hypothetical protein